INSNTTIIVTANTVSSPTGIPHQPDVISNFIASGSQPDKIDVSAVPGATTFQPTQLVNSTTATVDAHSVAWIQTGGNTLVFVNNTPSRVVASNAAFEFILRGTVNLTAANFVLSSPPAGIAGAPINLGLTTPPEANGGPVTVTVSGVPSGWQLNQGTN